MEPSTRQGFRRLLAGGVLALGLFVGSPSLLPHTPAAVLAAPVESVDSSAVDRQAMAAAPEPKVQPAPSNPYEDSTQCTYRAWELAANAGHPLPRFYNAENWRQAALDCGMKVEDTLTQNAVGGIAVWSAYTGGTGWAGHVGYVTKVDGNRFLVQDRNWVPATDTERWVEWEEGISFIILEQPTPEPAASKVAEASEQAPASATPDLTPSAPWMPLDLTSALRMLVPTAPAILLP